MSSLESFGDGLMQGYSFVEGIRAARDQREMRRRQMAMEEQEAIRAQDRHKWDEENHAEAVRQANEARDAEAMRRKAVSFRSLLQKYGSVDKIPDDAKVPFMTDVIAGFGDRNTRADSIQRDSAGNAIVVGSGKRPDGSSFSGKPLSRQGGTDDDPIVFSPGDIEDMIVSRFAPYDPEIGKIFEERNRERETVDGLRALYSGAQETQGGPVAGTSALAPAGSPPVAAGPRGISPSPSAVASSPQPAAAPKPVAAPQPAAAPQSMSERAAAEGEALATGRLGLDKVVAGVSKAVDAAKRAIVTNRWDLVLDENDPTNLDVRLHPEKYAYDYARDRETLETPQRLQLDQHFRGVMDKARSEEQQALDALTSRDRTKLPVNDTGTFNKRAFALIQERKSKAEVARVRQRLAQIDSTIRSMDDQRRVSAELGITREQKVGPGLAATVAPVLKAAAEGPVTDPSPGRLHAAASMTRSAQGKRRVTPAFIDSVSLLVARKIITPQEGERVLSGGSIDKPEFMNWNPSQALVRVGPDGVPSIVYAPDPRYVRANSAASKAAEAARSALNKSGRAYVTRLANDYEQAQGKYGKGTGTGMESGFYNFLATMPGAIDHTLGLKVMGEDGSIDLSRLHEGQIGSLWEGYVMAMNAKTAIEQQGAFSKVWGAITGKQQPSTNPLDYTQRPEGVAPEGGGWSTRAEVAALAQEYGVTEDEVTGALQARGVEIVD